jgi:hypothetical protein
MKKLILTFALIIGFTVATKAQTAVKVEPANSTSAQPATAVNTTASETPVSTTDTKPATEKKCAGQKACCKGKTEGTATGSSSCAKKEEKACCKKKTDAKKD